MKYTIYISAELDGLMYHNGNYISIIRAYNKCFKFTIDTINDNIFTFYPIENTKLNTFKLLPYSINIKYIDNNLYCDSNYIKLIKYHNNDYDLIFMPNLLFYKKNTEIKRQIKLDLGKVELHIDNTDLIHISLNNKQYSYSCKYNLQNIDFFEYKIDKNTYIILSANIEKYEYLYIFYVDNNGIYKLGEFLADKVEIKHHNLSILTTINDMAKHAIVTKYKIEKNNIVKTEKFLTTLKQNFTINKIELIPFAFLEAIKASNFELAKTFLTENLSAILSNEHLKRFFGIIYDIKQPHSKIPDVVSVINIIDGQYIGKNFKFTFKDTKIDNIDEVL